MKNKWFFGVVFGLGLSLSVATGSEPNTVVRLETNYGNILIKLYPEKAPVSVANFLGYVDSHFYDGLVFHRVIKNFVIQTGAYDPNLYDPNTGTTATQAYHQPGTPIINESTNGLKNLRGTVAMARTNDPNSATSQFYVNVVNNASLDPNLPGNAGYAVFGDVIGGIAVADAISNVTTATKKGLSDVPSQSVILRRAVRVEPNQIDILDVDQLTTFTNAAHTKDGFIIQGGLGLTSSQLDQSDFMEIHVGSWIKTIDPNAILTLGNGTYVYYGDPNGITLMTFDLQEGTFFCQAREINLAGLTAPIDFHITTSNYIGSKQIPSSPSSLITSVDPNQIDTIQVDQLTTRVGRNAGQDSFIIRGAFDLTPEELAQAENFEVHLGPWSAVIDANDLQEIRNTDKFTYPGEPNSLTLAVLDLARGTFMLQARDIDLTGLKDLPDFQIIAGHYYGFRQVPKTYINRKKGVPLDFLHGVQDALKVDDFIHVSDRNGAWLKVTGSIANALENINLTTLNDPNDLTITSDPNDMTITVNAKTYKIETFTQVGAGHFYRAKDASADLLWAFFDMDKGRFSFRVRNVGATLSATAKLKIAFPAPSQNYTFNKEVSLR